MKALHLTYRFGRDVVGGAEHYMDMLSRALLARGVEVDLWTTRTAALAAASRFGVRWDNAIAERRQRVGGLEVRRFTTVNLPDPLARALDRALVARWRREERQPIDVAPPAGTGVLEAGWYPVETWGPLRVRWTEGRAGIAIHDRAVSEISFEAMCPRKLGGRFELDGRVAGRFATTGEWATHRVPVRGDGVLRGQIVLDTTWQPSGDPRRLGIAVRSVRYTAAGGERSVDLADDRGRLLRGDRTRWLAHLRARARARPWPAEAAFFLLRGPLSPGMLWSLDREIRRYDVVLAQMTPFSTMNYAVHFGRKHGVPVVLLPHFHLDDDFYHLRHYYHAFRRADRVLACSDTQRAVFEELGARAEIVGGGGVDAAEFVVPAGAAAAFRRRFGLEDVPLILCVGRKSGSKRYDLLVRAVDLLNERERCRLVMIGPDEDGQPITSANVLYLGRQERATVIAAYHAADVFAMMSESESFGIVVLEAWMARKPVVGNRACTAVADLIADGKDGFLCGDEHQCAERIAELLGDRPLARRLGESGYDKAMRDYTWDAIGNKVATVYADVIRSRAGRAPAARGTTRP